MEVKPIGDKINERLNCPLSSKSRSRSILPLPPKEEAFSRHVTTNVGNKTDTKNALKRLRLRTKISFRGSTLFALSNDSPIKPLYADCGSARPVRRSFRIRINNYVLSDFRPSKAVSYATAKARLSVSRAPCTRLFATTCLFRTFFVL